MFQLASKINLDLRKQAVTVLKEHVVRKAVVEFHAQNRFPTTCRICMRSEHRGVTNVCVAAVILRAHKGRELDTMHTELCTMGLSSHTCKPAATSG